MFRFRDECGVHPILVIGRSCKEVQTRTPLLSVMWSELYVAMDQECIVASTKELTLNLER